MPSQSDFTERSKWQPDDESAPADAGKAEGLLEHSALREVPGEERDLALYAHIGGLLTFFLAPLLIWLIKRNTTPYVAQQAREALNFQLFLLVCYALGIVLSLIYVGYVLLVLLIIYEVYAVVQAAVAVGRGERFRYPVTIRFVS